MKPSKFDEIVTNRANERVQKKILAFKSAIGQALIDLTANAKLSTKPCFYGWYQHNKMPEDAKQYLALIQGDDSSGWPAVLWDGERVEVSREIMAQLDAVSKAMLAPASRETDVPVAQP